MMSNVSIKSLMTQLVVALLICVVPALQAAVLVDEAHVVTTTASVAASLPAPRSFDVAVSGVYTITVTDIGKQSNGATPFSNLTLVLYKNSQLIKQVSVPVATAAVNSTTVTLEPGTYSAQVLGATSGASLYNVTIASVSATVLSVAGAVTAASSSGSADDFSSLHTDLNLIAGRSYSITLQDMAFPAALESLQSTIVVDGSNVKCSLTASNSEPCSFVAGTTNMLFALATKAVSAVAGMYSIRIVDDGNSNDVVLASIYPVGVMPAPVAVAFPTTGSYQLITTDLKTPDPLNNLQTLLLQDITVLARQNATGTSQLDTVNANAGIAKLYVVGSPTLNGGIYGVQISQGTAIVYSNASVIAANSTTTQTGFYFDASLPVAGNYVLNLSDLNFPQSLQKLSVAVTQAGASLGSINAAGILSINAAAGAVQVNVIAAPNTSGQGLFGLTLAASGSSKKLLNVTQGVGGSFVTIPLAVTTAGTYTLNVTDMQAPQRLGQILVAVTRDTQFAGEVIGSGSVKVEATPGNYVLNVIANADTNASVAPFGMYGISFGNALSVNLTASATTVTSGSTIILDWNSVDATSCTASDGWSGTKTSSGSTSYGPILTDVKLTLMCSGPTGAASQSVNVTVKAGSDQPPPAKSSGGGGSFQWWMLSGLLLLLMLRTQHQRIGLH